MTAPARSELAALPVNVLVRDFPETLAVLRDAGVDVPRFGGGPVAEATDDASALLDALRQTIAWRGDDTGPPTDRGPADG